MMSCSIHLPSSASTITFTTTSLPQSCIAVAHPPGKRNWKKAWQREESYYSKCEQFSKELCKHWN